MGCKPVKFPRRPRLSLISKWINNAEVARTLGVSDTIVWNIRHGKKVVNTPIGRRVRSELARLSGKTVAEIWPGMDT